MLIIRKFDCIRTIWKFSTTKEFFFSIAISNGNNLIYIITWTDKLPYNNDYAYKIYKKNVYYVFNTIIVKLKFNYCC